MHELHHYPITHAGVKPVLHPALGVAVNAQTAVRYLRFGRPVVVKRLELSRQVYGRWVPGVPTHPAHLIISRLQPETYCWEVLAEVDMPPDPRIAGEGLSPSMSIEEMEAVLRRGMQEPLMIDVPATRTDLLRVECDREHPVWPNHGECNGDQCCVPFGMLDSLRAFGDAGDAAIPPPPYFPGLTLTLCRPLAPRGMSVSQRPDMLLFAGRQLSVGFSLRRPMLMQLGWDAFGGDNARYSRISRNRTGALAGLSGPLLRTFGGDFGCYQWSGEVAVEGNRISYANLHTIDGLRIDAVFTVEKDRLLLEIRQAGDRDMPVIEAEAWRFAFDVARGMTANAAVPTLRPGRNGDLRFPALWASDGVGCLSCSLLEGDPQDVHLQGDSYRGQAVVTAGIVLGRQSAETCLVLPAGEQRAAFAFEVTSLQPQRERGAAAPTLGLKRHWGSIFSCYRPEYGGFSNNAVSVNCHVNQWGPMELVGFTKQPANGPDPVALCRFTIGRALLGGGGYGFWRNLYLDSDPVLVSGAGRLHQVRPDRDWLCSIAPGLTQAAERMLGTIGAAGLAICKDLSGNTGSYRWSSNAMDVVGFGHMDGYVNAWTYRALRNAAALLRELGRDALAARCHAAAAGLKASYAAQLLNPETGWVAGWRSRDGVLHDYAFLWVNAVALAFGLLDDAQARRAIAGLEELRRQQGLTTAALGLPCNLLPIRTEDHMLPTIMGAPAPTFETYTDGSLMGCSAGYYLRALSRYGFQAQADRMAAELEEGLRLDYFSGGVGSGVEFKSWEGLNTGYEGSFVLSFSFVYALAIQQGVFSPTSPEWWPAE